MLRIHLCDSACASSPSSKRSSKQRMSWSFSGPADFCNLMCSALGMYPEAYLQTITATTTTSTLKVVSDLKMWMEESNNQAQVEMFAAGVTASLKRCLPCPQSSNLQISISTCRDLYASITACLAELIVCNSASRYTNG